MGVIHVQVGGDRGKGEGEALSRGPDVGLELRTLKSRPDHARPKDHDPKQSLNRHPGAPLLLALSKK